MRVLGGACALVLLPLALMSCRSLGASYDESRSLMRFEGFAEGAVAIVGPPEEAQFPGLAQSLGLAIRDALATRYPGHEFIDTMELYGRLQQHKGYYQHFGGWLGRYTQSGGFLETQFLGHYAKASRARYLLVLRDAEVKREKIDVRTAVTEVRRVRGCRMACVGDASNIVRYQLVVLAEIIDLHAGKVAWKGIGESNVITSRITKLDFGLVQHNFTQPDLGDYADQLVSYVANGVVDEIAGPAAQAPE